MADPLSVASGITGLLAFTVKLTGEVLVLLADIQHAPEDIMQLRAELRDLGELMEWTQTLSERHPLRPEDRPLEITVMKRVESCQVTIDDIKSQLSRFFHKGSGRRSPIQRISWTIRKGEIRDLKDRLRDSRAMLQLSVLVLNAHLSGKGQNEILSEMNRGMKSLGRQIRNVDEARKLHQRLEEDVESVCMSSVGDSSVRRLSLSTTADVGFPMRMFLGNANATSLAPPSVLGHGDVKPTPLISLESMSTGSTSEESSSLLEAATAGNTSYVQAMLASLRLGTTLSARDRGGRTALHICAMHDHLDTARALIENGADINTKDSQSGCPFRTAIVNRSYNVATLLLQRGCDLKNLIWELIGAVIVEGKTGNSVKIPGYDEFVSALRQRIDTLGSAGPHLTHEAIERNDDTSLEHLLKAGFDPNGREQGGVTLLHHAILQRRRATVALLLRHGANPNDFIDPEGYNRLRNDIPWHRRLLQGGFDDTTSTMALSTAAHKGGHGGGDPKMVHLLLQAGADPNQLFFDGGNVLESVCAGEFIDSARHLIDFGANFNHRDTCTVHWTYVCGNRDMLRHILDRGGVDLNRSCAKHDNRYPLHTAIHEKEDEMLRMTIEYGAKLDVRDKEGRRPIDLIDDIGECRGVRGFLEEKMREQGLLE